MLLYIIRLQYSINVTFICTEKQNIDITCFILIFMCYGGLEPNPKYL